jgi:hypothetical protein
VCWILVLLLIVKIPGNLSSMLFLGLFGGSVIFAFAAKPGIKKHLSAQTEQTNRSNSQKEGEDDAYDAEVADGAETA